MSSVLMQRLRKRARNAMCSLGSLAKVPLLFQFIQMQEDTPIEISRRKARGALSNRTGRYDLHRTEEADGWEIPEDRAAFKTDVSEEQARSIITYNNSPDLSFDRSINPYRGCEHGCVYCFARPTHAYLNLSPGLDFETRLIARPNAAKVLRRELSSKRYKVATVAMGTNTDPYQPIEKTYRITRACLQVLARFNHPVSIVTKGTLVERDLDILSDMAKQGLTSVSVSITTLDPDLSRRMEPRAPSPLRRLALIRRLSDAGVPVRVLTSPIVPGLTDHELESMLEEAAQAGATGARWIMLRLPREVSPLWQEWLAEHYPDRASKVMARLKEMHGGKVYDTQWHKRMRGEGPYADMISMRFKIAARRLGLAEPHLALRTDRFHVPPKVGDQLSLF